MARVQCKACKTTIEQKTSKHKLCSEQCRKEFYRGPHPIKKCASDKCTNKFTCKHKNHKYCCQKCKDHKRRIKAIKMAGLKDKNIPYRIRRSKNNRATDIRSYLVSKAKHRAKIKGMAFDIDYTKLEIPNVCPILGIKMQINEASGHGLCSLDRKDSNRGYTQDNVHIISYRANMLKSNGTITEFKNIVKWMEKNPI